MRRSQIAENRFHEARILVIDDQEANVRLLERMLDRAGYRAVSSITDPMDALETIRSMAPDLVLLDLRMPGLDGFGILEELSRCEMDDDYLPILVLTAEADPQAKRRALAGGAEDFLTKPFDLDEVLLRCRNLLEMRFLHRDLEERRRMLADTVDLRTGELATAREDHEAIVASLGRLSTGESLEATGAAVCEELCKRTGFDAVAVIGFTSDETGTFLASSGRLPLGRLVGRELPSARAPHLIGRAHQGPWSEEWIEAPDDSEYSRYVWSMGVRAALYAPLLYEDELVGVLAVGSGSEPAEHEQFRTMLPIVVDYAAVARVLVGPELLARRRRASSRAVIAEVIRRRAFRTVFQPIMELEDRRVLGYEALTRFDDGTRPDLRFAEAEVAGMGLLLEEACLLAAIDASDGLPASALISLNVSPAFLVTPRLLASVLEGSRRLVVLEITEHVPIDEYAELRAALAPFDGRVRLAIDDAGAGFASFRHILELKPDYVKLDIALVRSIESDPMRQALVTGLRYFSTKTGCTLIAEGIETEAESAALRELGVVFGQGYLLGRPAPVAESVAQAA